MADISLELGSITLGIDLPFLDVPKSSLGVGFDIPLTPAISVGADLSLKGRPDAVVFELSANVTLLNFLSIEYTLLSWSTTNPLSPFVEIPPLLLPPLGSLNPIPEPIEPESWTLTFDVPGTLFIYVCSEFGCAVTEVTIQPGNSFGGRASDNDICKRTESGSLVFGEDLFLNGNIPLGYICRDGADGTGNVEFRPAQTVGTLFIPSSRFISPRIGLPQGADPMTCSCAEIQAILDARFTLLTQQLVERLDCIFQDTRSMRIGFFGTPQTATTGYGLIATGVTAPLPGDLVSLEITPTTLPPGESQWLTDPKLYQIGVIVPVFADGKYGAPQTLIVPFGSSLRIPVQLSGIRRFYYSLLPGVSISVIATYQTGANIEKPEWC